MVLLTMNKQGQTNLVAIKGKLYMFGLTILDCLPESDWLRRR